MRSRALSATDYPFFHFTRVDLNIANDEASFYVNIPRGFNYFLKKINVSYPAPGTPPVFRDITLRLQVLGWGKTLTDNPVPFNLMSTPGAREVGSSYKNSSSVDYILMNRTSTRIIVGNYTPNIAGNFINVCLIGQAAKAVD